MSEGMLADLPTVMPALPPAVAVPPAGTPPCMPTSLASCLLPAPMETKDTDGPLMHVPYWLPSWKTPRVNGPRTSDTTGVQLPPGSVPCALKSASCVSHRASPWAPWLGDDGADVQPAKAGWAPPTSSSDVTVAAVAVAP